MCIYPKAFKCFGGSCGKHGDFIDFFLALYPASTFLDAINIGAEFTGTSTVGLGEIHQGALKEVAVKFKERKAIEEVYEAACDIAHEYLMSNTEIQQFAWDKWGFGKDFIEKKQEKTAEEKELFKPSEYIDCKLFGVVDGFIWVINAYND